MFFERTDGAFGCVASVYIGRNKLIVDVLVGEELFEFLWCFVIKYLDFGLEATS